MTKAIWIFVLSFSGVFLIDQNIKALFLNGFSWSNECISFILTINKGIAFSMFSFLGKSLKYIQLILIGIVGLYLFFKKEIFIKYSFPLGLLLGAGCSNIYDRFLHGGVIDYIYWHCGFNFAIFNFADVVIDFSVLLILYISYKTK